MNKRSKSLSLVLMGSLTVGLSGCSDDPGEEFKAYNSIEQCVKEQIYSPQECREMAIAAVQQTPRFNDKAECEKEFGEGNCQDVAQNQQGQQNVQGERRSSWMPLIAGYMVGRYMGGNGYMQGAQPLFRQPGQQQQGAAARPSGGFVYRTLGGGSVQSDAGGKVANPPQSVRQGFTKTAKPYVARSGGGKSGGFFGGRSSS